jgi:DNA (cytosine-5)-methyltransferase 1
MKPLMYDLYCKAGGATKGYQRAGFRVIGIDKEPQPRYCGDGFYQMDALEFLRRYLAGEYERAAAFAASPPCQGYTLATRVWRARGYAYPDLVAETRELLIQTGLHYVIENVKQAPLRNPTMLNGAFAGGHVLRDRYYEASFTMPFVLLRTQPPPVKMGRPVKAGEVIQPVGHFSGVDYAREQMGCPWMTQGELAEAVPPAHTEFIGRQLMAVLAHEGVQ